MTLEQYADKLYSDNPGTRISLAIEGIEAFLRWDKTAEVINFKFFLIFLRGHKTRLNRQFRQAVLNSGPEGSGGSTLNNRRKKKVPSEAMFSDVSRVECEEALVRLQLRNGCVSRMCEDGEQLAEYVVSLTKALCESYYR